MSWQCQEIYGALGVRAAALAVNSYRVVHEVGKDFAILYSFSDHGFILASGDEDTSIISSSSRKMKT